MSDTPVTGAEPDQEAGTADEAIVRTPGHDGADTCAAARSRRAAFGQSGELLHASTIGFVRSRLPTLVASIPASIHAKLLVAFIGMVALLVSLGLVGLRVLHDAHQQASELVLLERRIAAFRQVQHNTREQLYTVASAFLATGPRQLDTALRDLHRLAYDFERAQFMAQEDQQRVKQIEAGYRELLNVGTRIIELVREGRSDEARQLHNARSIALSDRLERQAYSLVNRAESDMVERVELSSEAYRRSQTAVVVVALAAIGLSLLLGYAISCSLIDPVRAIRAKLRSIARGDFAGELKLANRDELGDLARNVNRMNARLDRLYRELEAASEHKSAFLANMSHELRTPMNAIIGFNRLVMRRCKDVLPPKHYENLGKIAQAADHLLNLINTVLDLSKIEAGRVEARLAEFPPGPILEQCVNTIEPMLHGKAVRLRKSLAEDLPKVYSDQDKLRQIVLNILSNAAKFTKEGQISLTARATADQQLRITIEDTGIGIPADQVGRIFDEFTQVDDSTTRLHAGTGLGLAISRRLARLLGGDITVRSEPGQGSVFTVVLPLRMSEPVSAAGFGEVGGGQLGVARGRA